MLLRWILSAALVLPALTGSTLAQEMRMGATYQCNGAPNFILESCAGEYCHVQMLNPAAPDGKGAALDLYRSMMPDRMKMCTPSGGTAMAAPPARNPNAAPPLRTGATYQCTGSPDFIVESCAGEYCHVQSLNPAAPDGKGAALDLYRSMMPDRMRGCTASGGTPVAAPAAAPVPARAQTVMQQPAAAPAQKTAGSCVSDPGVTTAPGSKAPLAAQIKHAIYENYTGDVDGGITSPLSIGVTFQQFNLGAALTNRVTPQGYEYPGAAIGTPIYPVTTRHTYCRAYNNATTRTLFKGSYVCFLARSGSGMVCGTAEGHQMLGYQ